MKTRQNPKRQTRCLPNSCNTYSTKEIKTDQYI